MLNSAQISIANRKKVKMPDSFIISGYSLTLKQNFTHHSSSQCVLHSTSEPFKLNGISNSQPYISIDIKRSQVNDMLYSGFPSREYDILRFNALTN